MQKSKVPIRRITIRLSKELYDKFTRASFEKFGSYGNLSKASQEAISLWLKQNKK